MLLLLPQGGVVFCGQPRMAATRRAAPEEASSLEGLPPHVRAFYTQTLAVRANGFPSGKDADAQNPPPSDEALSRPQMGRSLLVFTTSFAIPQRLPSLLLPANVLQCHRRRCRWQDIKLYAGGTVHAALQSNARLCRALQLPDVANLFSTLYRLAKGAGEGGSTSAYVVEVLGPVLGQTVRQLQTTRQPFWAGVAVCCLLLPRVVDDRRGFELPTSLPQYNTCLDVVRLTERVLYVVKVHPLMCEARLVRMALERQLGMHESASPLHSAPVAARHEPVTVCAVCSLSLQRQTLETAPKDVLLAPNLQSGRRKANTLYSSLNCSTYRQQLLTRGVQAGPNSEGCLVVQCIRCGHGGHVEHITSWWADPSVRGCPSGCDCMCTY